MRERERELASNGYRLYVRTSYCFSSVFFLFTPLSPLPRRRPLTLRTRDGVSTEHESARRERASEREIIMGTRKFSRSLITELASRKGSTTAAACAATTENSNRGVGEKLSPLKIKDPRGTTAAADCCCRYARLRLFSYCSYGREQRRSSEYFTRIFVSVTPGVLDCVHISRELLEFFRETGKRSVLPAR